MKKKHYNSNPRLILLILIILLAIFLRLWKIWNVFSLNELVWGYDIVEIVKSGIIKHFLTFPLLNWYHGPLGYYPGMFSIYLLGQNIIALKLPFVISGLIAVVFTYFLTKELYKYEEALLATFIIAILPTHIVLTTTSLQYIFTSMFVVLVFYFFYKYYKTYKGFYLYLGSFTASLGILMRLSFLFFFLPFTIFASIFEFNFIRKFYKQFILALLFFFLPFTPLFLHFEENMEAVFYRIKRTYPITPTGMDLRDIKNNLKKGFLELFPLSFHIEYPPSNKIFNFFTVFSFFIIVLVVKILLNICNFLKTLKFFANKKVYTPSGNYSFLKKDLFILLLLMGTITLTSILAFNQVHVEEYVIVTPLVAIISGRGICEMLKISKNFCIKLLILSLLMVLIFLSTYSDINFLIKRNVSVCIIHLPELAQILNQTNFTVKGEQTMFHNALKWYGAKAEGCAIFDSEKGEPTVQKEIEILIQNNEKVLYVFQSPECSHYPKFQEKFVEKVNSYNKSIIKEIVNFGEINYTIYQVR